MFSLVENETSYEGESHIQKSHNNFLYTMGFIAFPSLSKKISSQFVEE